MIPSNLAGKYSPVSQLSDDTLVSELQPRQRKRWWKVVVFAAALAITLGIVAAFKIAMLKQFCLQPALRREWRGLSAAEQKDYLMAVKCLHDHPSRINVQGKLSDDFPWIHFQVRFYTHDTAAFLSWHRWFIHLYEKELQETCGYNGHLPYWDWSIDWEDLPASPIWSSTLGFGGDGDHNTSRKNMPRDGSCIENGPFSDYEVRYFGQEASPHCLTRGFGLFPASHNFSGERLSPAALKDVLNQDDFYKFLEAVENGPHDVIPFGAGGDFMTLTAPNDPLFFLHHAQLDRLWWMWQQKDRGQRLYAYHGSAEHSASADDVLPYEPLSTNITVRDILDTRTSRLCYRY